MSEKKISGYVIHTKQILGKGTYGSVLSNLLRFTEGSKMSLRDR